MRAEAENVVTDRQTDRPTDTLTEAAHARRGLIIIARAHLSTHEGSQLNLAGEWIV